MRFVLLLIMLLAPVIPGRAEGDYSQAHKFDPVDDGDLRRLGQELERRSGINPEPNQRRRNAAGYPMGDERGFRTNITFWLVLSLMTAPVLAFAGLTLKYRFVKWSCPQCKNDKRELMDIHEASTEGVLPLVNLYECRCLACGWCWIHPPPPELPEA